MNKKEKLIILGGSFDPIHLGHLKLLTEACAQPQVQRVLLIPTAVSPFKTGAQRRLGAYRLQMCKLALADLCNLELELDGFSKAERMQAKTFYDAGRLAVSDLEILRSGTSYTIDTLQELAKLYPDLQAVILGGSDIIEGLHLWHNYEQILAQAHFLIAKRPGYEDRETARLAAYYLEQYQAQITFLDVEMPNVSSTALRKDLSNYPFPAAYNFAISQAELAEQIQAAEFEADYSTVSDFRQLPLPIKRFHKELSASTLTFILQNYLYQQVDLQKELSVSDFQMLLELVNYCYQHLPLPRALHCYNVMYMAVALQLSLAAKKELSSKSAQLETLSTLQTAVAALFHDAAKYDNLQDYPQLAAKLEVEALTGKELMHGPLAAYILEQQFQIKDAVVLAAVYYHTTLRASATLLDEIVYVADKIEAGRTYKDAPALRLQLRSSFDLTVKEIIRSCICLMEQKGQAVHPYTLAAFAAYAEAEE